MIPRRLKHFGSPRLCRPRWVTVVGAVVLLATAGARGVSAAAPEYEPEERAAALARPALVLVDVRWEASGGGRRCSGFVVDVLGHVVTSAACLYSGGTGDELSGHPDIRVQWGAAEPGTANGRTATAQEVAPGRPGPSGVAILSVDPGPNGPLPVAQLVAGRTPSRGRPVVALGYPGEVDEVTRGPIEPVDRWGTFAGAKTFELGPRFDISVATLGALAGGPVVDTQGRVLGMATAPSATAGAASADERFGVIPAAVLVDDLRAAGITNEVGPLDITYRQALDDFYQGNYPAAIVGFEAMAGKPGRQDADTFRARANDLVELDRRRGTGTPVLIVASLVVLAGGAVLVFRTRAKNRRPQLINTDSTENPEDIPL